VKSAIPIEKQKQRRFLGFNQSGGCSTPGTRRQPPCCAMDSSRRPLADDGRMIVNWRRGQAEKRPDRRLGALDFLFVTNSTSAELETYVYFVIRFRNLQFHELPAGSPFANRFSIWHPGELKC
jgi:hypothetical protein